MKLNDKIYNILKWLSLVFFDAVGVAYKSLAGVWNLPLGEEVMQTCVIISVLLGTLIGISTISYQQDINKELKQSTNNCEGDDLK